MTDDDLPFGGAAACAAAVAPGPDEPATAVIRIDPADSPERELPPEFGPLPGQTDPQRLGHYDVRETIGRGGAGVVVLAFDRLLERVVAVKMMSVATAATSPARKRFLREARAGAAVRHDNVVAIYAVEEWPVPHLVMEYVPGGSLQSHLDRVGPLAVPEVLRLGGQVARGLAAAHATGLIHRDVKPANVLLEAGDSPRAKLTDFGIARAADDASLTQSGTVVGTPMYMAPEQAKGERVDHRADLFSLGSVLYTMVSGRPPFRASSSLAVIRRVADDTPRPIQEIIPETPAWLCAVIARLHARNPDDRYQSAAAVADVLEQCLADLGHGRPVRCAADPRPRQRWRAGVAVAGILASVAVAGLTAAWPQEPRGQTTGEAAPSAVASAADPAPATFTNAFGTTFVKVPAGASVLGGWGGVVGRQPVVVPYDFYMGAYEVTHAEWEKVMGPGTDPSQFARTGSERAAVAAIPDVDLDRFPVENLSWNDCRDFLGQLNRRAAETGWVYRLPTSVEWEYACRNGPGQLPEELGCGFFAGDPVTTLPPDRVNSAAGGLNRPCRVGSYPPNRLGLSDLHGNVIEFLDDMAATEPRCRLKAGGRWCDPADQVAAACRAWAFPDIRLRGSGLRLVRVPADSPPTTRQLFEAVAGDLRRSNPGFTGQVVPTVADDRITGVSLSDAKGVTDLFPLRRLRHLETFVAWDSDVTDLTPLAGLPLRELVMSNNWALRSLVPLRGMRLEKLHIWGFQGHDLSPLAGMPLRDLNCGGGRQKLDLSPLAGLPLTQLCVNSTQADDLTPLAGMRLDELLIVNTRVADLSPLRRMKLRKVCVAEARVTDLSPLRDMPLQELSCDFVAARDAATLRSIPTLTKINDKPAVVFLFPKEGGTD